MIVCSALHLMALRERKQSSKSLLEEFRPVTSTPKANLDTRDAPITRAIVRTGRHSFAAHILMPTWKLARPALIAGAIARVHASIVARSPQSSTLFTCRCSSMSAVPRASSVPA
jgi:hypothetical protein